MTGFTPGVSSWASTLTAGVTATLTITTSDVYTVNLLMREDGLRIDRLLVTTDTTFIPTGFGPAETDRQLGGGGLITPLTRTIVYTYDNLYRLTEADYTTGENYQYSYDPVGNRLEQVINGDTTEYLYDAANRLAQLNGQAVYSFDNNGNLLNSDTLTNTFDAANRLVETQRDGNTVQPIYNGVNDRVGQVTTGVTTTFALDIAGGLPEVIYTSEGNAYLHLPGVIRAESSTGEIRYLLSDGLGSVRQAVDDNAELVAYHEFDPYGNPNPQSLTPNPYGFTGEWWENEVGLLHLRARWYLVGDGDVCEHRSGGE
jgi:YD repeat-containing protein